MNVWVTYQYVLMYDWCLAFVIVKIAMQPFKNVDSLITIEFAKIIPIASFRRCIRKVCINRHAPVIKAMLSIIPIHK